MVVRVVLWSLGDARTTIDELRDRLEPLEAPSAWLWNEPAERFGALVVGDEPDISDRLTLARELIGKEPEAFEEFDALL